jgi:hypothetical protein
MVEIGIMITVRDLQLHTIALEVKDKGFFANETLSEISCIAIWYVRFNAILEVYCVISPTVIVTIIALRTGIEPIFTPTIKNR